MTVLVFSSRIHQPFRVSCSTANRPASRAYESPGLTLCPGLTPFSNKFPFMEPNGTRPRLKGLAILLRQSIDLSNFHEFPFLWSYHSRSKLVFYLVDKTIVRLANVEILLRKYWLWQTPLEEVLTTDNNDGVEGMAWETGRVVAKEYEDRIERRGGENIIRTLVENTVRRSNFYYAFDCTRKGHVDVLFSTDSSSPFFSFKGVEQYEFYAPMRQAGCVAFYRDHD